MKDILQPVLDEIVRVFNEELRPAIDELKEALEPYMPMIKDIAVAIGAILLGAIVAITVAIGALILVTVKLFTWFVKFNTLILDLGVSLKDKLKGQLESTREKFNDFKDSVSDAWDWVKKLISKLGEFEVPQALKDAADLVGEVSGSIGEKFSGDSNATGTSFYGGGLTSINERGTESIVLPKGTRINSAEKTSQMASNSNATFNINIGTIADQTLIDELVDKIENIQARRNKLANFNIS